MANLGKRKFFTVTGKGYRPDIWRLGRWRYILTALLLIYATLALFMPLAQMIIGSLQRLYGLYNWELYLGNYEDAFARPSVQRALRNTVLIAVGGGFLADDVDDPHRVRGHADHVPLAPRARLLRLLPWTLPGIVLGLGMLWAYLSIPGAEAPGTGRRGCSSSE